MRAWTHDKRGSWCGFSGLARICLIGGHASAMCSEENSAEDATQDTKLAIRLRCDGLFSRHFWHRAIGRGISQAFYFRAWQGTRLCAERCMVQCVLGTLFTSPTRQVNLRRRSRTAILPPRSSQPCHSVDRGIRSVMDYTPGPVEVLLGSIRFSLVVARRQLYHGCSHQYRPQ